MPKLDLSTAWNCLVLGAGAVLVVLWGVPLAENVPILGITLWSTVKVATFVAAGVGVFAAKWILERFG